MTAPIVPSEVEETIGACDLTTPELIERIMAFVELFSNVKLYTYQKLFAYRIVESVLNCDGAIVTGLWARQCGKTETVASLSVGLAVILPVLATTFPGDARLRPFAKGFKIGIYAPIEKQALLSFDRMRKTVISPFTTEILNDDEIGVTVTASRGDTIAFSNGSVIIARTASGQSQIEGETHHLVICEEAQKLLRSKVEKEIRPMLASTNGTMVNIGTAWESRGGFHHTIQKNVELYKTTGIRNHFEFPYDIVIAEKERAYSLEKKLFKADPHNNPAPNPFHLNYQKFVDSELVRLGSADTEEFKMNFRCLWMESRVIAITEAVLKGMRADTVEAGPRRGPCIVAGLDIAKTNDATVLTLMEVNKRSPIVNPHYLEGADTDKQFYYQKCVVDWLQMQGSFEGNTGQYQTLINYLRMTNVQVLCIDATAMGDPVFERIEAMIGDQIRCIPYRFTSMSKSLLYKYYMQELNAGRLFYANGPITKAERQEHKWFEKQHLDLDRQSNGGYVVYLAPEGEHDDYPDSAALACWAEKMSDSLQMPTITSSSAPQGWGGTSRNTRRGGDVSYSGSSLPTVEVVSNRGDASLFGQASRTNRYARRW